MAPVVNPALWVADACHPACRRTPPTVLTVDMQNVVAYQDDVSDPSKFATLPGITPSVPPKNFFVVTLIGDIVAVNGQPAKGTYVGRTRVIQSSPAPVAGGAIADVTRTAMREHIFEILKSDGTPVGTIVSSGFSGGDAPPGTGAPSGEHGNWVISGGTGAFLGARGQVGGTGGAGGGGIRAASMAEEPANRRINGGANNRFLLHIIPMSVPQIVTTAGLPAVMHHSDSTLVTPTHPAVPGETLSLIATDLGPTNPDVDPGQPFPSNPLAKVNSPLGITVNGEAADILDAVGYPRAIDAYQVNFRIPLNARKGLVEIQLSAAWIAGKPVIIVVH